MSVFLTSCGQNKTGLSQVNIKSAPSAPIDSNYTQFRDHTEPGHHNVVHEFTYLVAMRDFCNKTLLQMRANGEVNKKLSKELERELLNANAELASSKFNGFKIELGLYEIFLKQINDKFRKERSC
jgi:hypothetical protein